MRRFSFRGGVHPPEAKGTGGVPIEVLPVPDQVIIPLLQHTGSSCTPLVKVGDSVKTGQKIGEADGFISANVHSSVTGKVSAISSLPHPVGKEVSAVVIDADEKEEWVSGANEKNNWDAKDPTDIKAIIQEAGIVGMGGAAFPTHVKLSPPAGKHIDTLIITGAECEPYLTADHRLMLERTEDIVTGIRILMRVIDVNRVFFAVEQNKMDAIEKIQSVFGNDSKIECRIVRTKYPQGGEKQLIQALTQKEVPSGGLPMDCGCVVHHVGTALAVMEAVCLNRPLIERVLTITGSGIRQPKNLKVRIGTMFQTAFNTCGGLTEDCKKIISGGPMMGITQWSLNAPIVKTTSGIFCLAEKEVQYVTPRSCISCGFCFRVCPIHLMPARIVQNAELKRWEAVEKLGIFDCMECGCCAYVCPSKINLVHYLKWGKNEILSKREKEKTAKAE